MEKSVKPGFVAGWRSRRRHPLPVLLIIFLALSGCALHLEPVDIRSPDRDLFVQGVDTLAVADSSEAFSRLADEFPDSPWTARAQAIGSIQAQLKTSQEENAQLRKSLEDGRKALEGGRKALEECRAERDKLATDARSREELQKSIDTCRIEKARLSSDIRSLEKLILKLKSLLAESGIAEPTESPR